MAHDYLGRVLRSAGVFLVSLVLAMPAAAGERVILEGLPTSMTTTGPGQAKSEVLGPEEREERRVRIVARDGKLFWVTREDRELTYAPSGIAHHFIDVRGGGSIKVTDYRNMELLYDPVVQFSEHVNMGMWFLSYFGEVTSFSPPKVQTEYQKSWCFEERYE